MRREVLKTVIIDDYPLQIQIYRFLLKQIEETSEKYTFKISEANSCDSAIDLLDRLEAEAQEIDLVILELKLPSSKRGGYQSGEEIATEIRNRFEETKIIINTAEETNYSISTILNDIKPEGFLINSDVSWDVLKSSLTQVLKNAPFYSAKVLRFIQKSKTYERFLDEWDRKILYELSLGCKMKELPGSLPLSLPAIEKRKRNIKSFFGVEGRDDKELLAKAKEFGVI